jgi:hypothetical protein
MVGTTVGRRRGSALRDCLAVVEPSSFGWHVVATLATLLMTLFIQRSEHRDTQAIHGKLDELLRANGDARNQLTSLPGSQRGGVCDAGRSCRRHRLGRD